MEPWPMPTTGRWRRRGRPARRGLFNLHERRRRVDRRVGPTGPRQRRIPSRLSGELGSSRKKPTRSAPKDRRYVLGTHPTEREADARTRLGALTRSDGDVSSLFTEPRRSDGDSRSLLSESRRSQGDSSCPSAESRRSDGDSSRLRGESGESRGDSRSSKGQQAQSRAESSRPSTESRRSGGDTSNTCSENGALTPRLVTTGSNRRVGWRCSEGHEWQAVVGDRAVKETGCPTCWQMHLARNAKRRLGRKPSPPRRR